MAVVRRLAGALLVDSAGEFFLVGNLKEPCDFNAAGFEEPSEIDATKEAYIRLTAQNDIIGSGTCLAIDLEGEALAKLLAERLIIARNGSVSERLWRLIIDPSGQEDVSDGPIHVGWLAEMPSEIWQIVRDTVLRCL
jgi:hypothetical protein